MPFLYQKGQRTEKISGSLTEGEIASLVYHDIFGYPLTPFELIHWAAAGKWVKANDDTRRVRVKSKNGFYFLEGHEGVIYKRLIRERISKRKLALAKKACKILRRIPNIKMVGITGALAMGNADGEADIDLVVITREGTLWMTRLLTLSILAIFRVPTRRHADKNQKDKLCLNLWLDERHVTWPKGSRNIYTAHEIAQIIPLVNKDRTYEKFLRGNKWVRDYWPNAARFRKQELGIRNKAKRRPIIHNSLFIIRLIEPLARKLQFVYMKKRITSETVTPTRALFHPMDWGSVVLERLGF